MLGIRSIGRNGAGREPLADGVADVETDLAGWQCCNYSLIKEVHLEQNGGGTMILSPIPGRKGEAPELVTSDFGVHWATIYRYRARLVEIDEATAIAGRTRGWKPLASRLSVKQEQGIEDERLTLKPEDLGPRITYLATGPVTETSVPDDYCDFAVPFA